MSNDPNVLKVKSRVEKYIRQDAEGGCWVWVGAISKDGYGKSWYRGKTIRAHRLSFLVYKNIEIPADKLVLHKCDNPVCVNPDHLFLGSFSENTKDMYKKGRGVDNRGEKCGTSKLKKRDIENIKKLWIDGRKQWEIAKNYKITQSNVSRIVNEKTWKK